MMKGKEWPSFLQCQQTLWDQRCCFLPSALEDTCSFSHRYYKFAFLTLEPVLLEVVVSS